MKKRNVITIFIIIILSIYGAIEIDTAPIERLGIPSIFAYDLDKDGSNNIIYKTFLSIYSFGENDEIFSVTYTGSSASIVKSQEERQLKVDKRVLLGIEKVNLISERWARYGIKSIIDLLFKLPRVNDTSLVAVCKDDISSIIEYPIEGYPSSGDYIEGMLKNASQYNFFPKNLRILDLFINLSTEGKTLKIPYIEITKEGLSITGQCLFKHDKMIAKLDLKDSRLLNMLSINRSNGILTLEEAPDKYTECSAKVKRKVSCFKVDDKYNFTISLQIRGNILSNKLYKNLIRDSKIVHEFENKMAKKLEAMCDKFINKMKNEYKVDCLDLGSVAAAKYGKDTGVDWDETVSKSNIKVNISIKIGNQGRGDY